MDPLSDVLSLLKPQNYMSGGIDAGGAWSLQFEEYECTRCFALVSGHCWLSMEGYGEPVRLEAGDCVVMPYGRPYRLASDLTVPPLDLKAVLTSPLNGRILTWNGGGACLGLSAYFTFGGEHAGILLGLLPPIVHIRNESDRTAMRWYLERMMRVLREPQPGSFLLGLHLAQMMLVEALRLHIADRVATGNAKDSVGWIFALADTQLSAAIAAMHEAPARRWTLQKLAELAGMSRSTFALRFKEKVGTSAMEYLTRWRMLRAGDRLTNSLDSVSEIALSLGYASESAFGLAFKRVMGRSPRQYSRGKSPTPPFAKQVPKQLTKPAPVPRSPRAPCQAEQPHALPRWGAAGAEAHPRSASRTRTAR
jgi:AraC-like DNA-binding protein